MIIKKLIIICTLFLGIYTVTNATTDPASSSSSSSSSNLLGGLAEKLGITQGTSNEPLHPDEAFKLSVINRVTNDGNQLEANWVVTPGHYLYREKTTFKVKSPEGISLGEAIFPKAKMKHDEYLGDTEVYEHDFLVNVPVKNLTHEAGEVTIVTSYQGCSENTGICYPPQHKTHTLKLAAITPAKTTDTAANELPVNDLPANDLPVNDLPANDLPANELPANDTSENNAPAIESIDGLGGSDEPLHPDEAFKLTVTSDGDQLDAHWKVTPGHYLYREKTAFKVKSPEGVTLGDSQFPKSKTKHDEFLGDTEVYEHDFSVKVPVKTAKGAQPDEVTVVTTYQGCSELTGICYPPQHKTHTVKLAEVSTLMASGSPATNKVNSQSTQLPEDVKIKATDASIAQTATSNTNTNTSNNSGSSNETTVSEQDAILDKIKSKSMIGTILMFLLFGIGLALTPCVFPMIPILSGIIAGQGDNITTKKAFGLSVSYVIPMAIVYAIVGIIAGLGGANIQVMFQNPWVISAFAIIFVLLSLSMFGFYELQMPASIQTKLSNISNRQESGSYLGAAIMGVLSALIVGPCVTAPLIAALSYIAQTGDAVLGGLSLFALGMGMGIPLILIGTSAGKLLPKAGAWMNATKAIFGVLLLAMAIWMLERILPFPIIIALSGILLIVSGIYLNATNPISKEQSKWSYLWKGFGFIMLLYGSLMLIGVAGGGKSLLQPLKGVFAGSGVSATQQVDEGLVFQRVKNIAAFNAVLATAKQNNQAVMLDFYADWCVSCKEMEHTTFKQPGVINALKNVILIQADVTKNNDDDTALLKKFGLFGPPGILFFGPDGAEQKAYRKVGYVNSEKFQGDIEKFLGGL